MLVGWGVKSCRIHTLMTISLTEIVSLFLDNLVAENTKQHKIRFCDGDLDFRACKPDLSFCFQP